MSRLGLFVFVALASVAIAQSLPKSTVIVSRLSPPIYPKLALQARIATSVVLDVAVRPDGSVDSVALVTGHPMLDGAAMESAQKTEFECRNCREPSTLYHMTYRFELGDALYYTGGWYENRGTKLYVNRGIGTTGCPIRLGARPEITVLELSPQD
jgi:TonB family protein